MTARGPQHAARGTLARHGRVIAILTGALIVARSDAQPLWRLEGDATWSWQVSTDSGHSWLGGAVEVPLGQPSVLVRATCAFDRPTGTNAYYGYAFIDAFVSGVGLGDSITGIGRASSLQTSLKLLPLLVSAISSRLMTRSTAHLLVKGRCGPA